MTKTDFYIKNVILENTTSYTYLGITIDEYGNFSRAITSLRDKARKATFALQKSIFDGKLNINLALRLFDQLIRPIPTNCSNIWGPFISQINKHTEQLTNISTSFNNYIFEKLHLKFCKIILGVYAKASNDAVRGELGRRPIIFFILKSAMKYWVRLQTIDDKNTQLYKTIRENVDLALHYKC